MSTTSTAVRRKPVPAHSWPASPEEHSSTAKNQPVSEGDNAHIPSETNETLTVEPKRAKTIPPVLKEQSPESRSRSVSTWNPGALHWLTLVSFFAVYVMMLATTIVLFEVSRSNAGLATSKSSHHYAWTYGPMAVLVLVAGAWHQVDYQCRMLAPWLSLTTGPKPAANTLLLDYISPIPPIACFRAAQNRDWAAAASSAAGMLLDLALVFSTALLILIPVTRTVTDDDIPLSSIFSSQNVVNYSGDPAAVMSYWATIDRGLGLPYGSTNSTAFNPINSSFNSLRNESLVAQVPMFVPKLQCEVADLNFTIGHTQGWHTDSPELDAELLFAISQSTSSCQTMSMENGGPNMLQDVVPPRILTGILGDAAVCENLSVGYVAPWTWTVLDMRYTQIFGPSQNDTLNVTMWHAELANATSIMCYPSYAIHLARVTSDTNPNKMVALELDDSSPPAYIDGFNNSQFSTALSLALDPLFQTLPLKWKPLDLTQQTSDSAGFTLMSMLQPDTTIEKFLDANEMANAAETVFNGIAAQFANIELSIPSTASVNGSRQFSELRIVVKGMPVIVLSVCFGLLAILSIVILMVRPQGVVPRSPRSLMANALLMQESPDIRQRLSFCGKLSDSDLKLSLLGFNYRSECIASKVVQETTSTSGVPPALLNSFDWWRPFASRLYFTLVIVVILCGLIAGLQVVEHFSHEARGFLYLSASGAAARRWSSIVPTAVMVLTKLAIHSSGGTLLLFVPFAMLKQARTSSWRASKWSPMGQLPIENLVRGMKYQRLSVVVVSLALILCSFLSIIVSGLYTVTGCTYAHNKTVLTVDYFNYNWNTTANSSSPDNYAGLNFALLNLHNMSYPAWTFEELVYPRIDQSTLTSGLQQSISAGRVKVLMEIPAIRASLDCTFAIPGRATSLWVKNAPGPSNEMNFVQNNQIYVPQECRPSAGRQIINTTTTIPAIILDEAGQYYSVQNEYPWPPYKKSNNAFPGQCPQFGFTFGFAGPHSNSTDNITSLTCYQQIQQVRTVTTFVLPDWIIDVTSQPRVDEDSVETLVQYADYWLGKIFSGGLGDTTYAPLEPFFINVISGSEGVPEADMLGPQNQEKLFSAVQHMYRKYMAQAIHLNMRTEVTTPSQAKTYTASVLDSDKLCLLQNRPPRIALQAVLGTILLCMLTGYILIPTRKLLPHSPLSIAGTWSLVANGPFGRSVLHGGLVPDDTDTIEDGALVRQLREAKLIPRLGFWSEDGEQPIALEVGEERLRRCRNTHGTGAHEEPSVWYGIGVVTQQQQKQQQGGGGREAEHGGIDEEQQVVEDDRPILEEHVEPGHHEA
ncbi:hypothetical protein LTR84_009750 [Exophiala bonariae]|uniref:Uncharacterized protein n=1 Tax=Exophiala bonariae TaxID=1690606 RepID=A0AAV9NJ75_9EURO|nr:hypothetical protein LTR84_009750 [Exophiala bonariae]